MGNRKVKLLVNNLKRIIKARNMEPLQKKLYEFIHLHCGFIAHYNLNGFKHTYYEGQEFQTFLEDLKEGCNVYACDMEDNYNYGYTNKEVKEAIAEILTDELLGQIQQEVNVDAKQERFGEYQRLKAEFGGA
tara:strand:- start:761 stop:1156 length:396 start_codon:yes stop_codon:yes gene_type:complete